MCGLRGWRRVRPRRYQRTEFVRPFGMISSVALYSDRMSRTDAAHAETGPPHPRALWRGNRLCLTEAARLLVAEKGLDAGAAEIASRRALSCTWFRPPS